MPVITEEVTLKEHPTRKLKHDWVLDEEEHRLYAKVSIVDIIEGNVPQGEDFWCDHVLYDIPETLAGCFQNAPVNCVAFTIAEPVAMLRHRFEKMFDIVREKNLTLYVARSGLFERVLYKDWLKGK